MRLLEGGYTVAHKRKSNTTKLEIVQVASRMFLEKGYSKTTIKAIADELDISTGHLMFYFPSKEHLLAVLTQMLCDFQWRLMQELVEEGNTSLMAVCLELATMTAACEEDEVAKDFFLSAYSSPLALEIIRKNDKERSKMVFGEFCPEWKDAQYAEAEILVSGVEYATLMTNDDAVSLDIRVTGALNCIMSIYHVPEETRRLKTDKVLALDYRTVGKRVLKDFKDYVEEVNEQAFEDRLK